jgi:hypothetical protein
VTGVGITYTGSDGVFFRSAANAGIRPATGDLKTITAATGTTVRAFATKPGTATITATGGGLTATATFTVSPAVVATARNITAVAAAGRVTASVKDGWGNPVAGVVVNFAADSKGIFGTGADVVVIASLAAVAQSAAAALTPVADFATAGNGTVTVTAKPTAGAASTDTAITAVKTDVATANAAVKALATQVTVLQASVATLIDSLTTQIASLMKSVSALTKAVAKLQTATKKK